MIEDREQRVLVAAPMPAQKALRRLLAACNADFFDDYDLAALSLRRRNYAVAIVGLQFAESRMLDFVREVRSTRPEVRVICVIATRSQLREASRRSCQMVLRALGVEGLLDFTTENLSRADRDSIQAIVVRCRRRHADCETPSMERRKEHDPLHAPDEPTGEELPVEPEMDKGPRPDRSGAEPPEGKPL
jgi:hypothetical protein